MSPAPGRQDPLRVTFAFPKNFTMLEYSTGGFLEGGLDRTEVRWVTKLVNSTYFQVKFLPFQTSKTDLEMWKKPEVLRERSTALSISSVFPDKGDLVLTVDLLFEVSPVMVESWSPYSPYGFIEILKLDLKKCIILDVSDGNGSCKKDITLTEPTYSDIPDPSRISAVQELGYYRPDFELNGIVIYPRYHLKRDNYFFKVSYSVKFSQDYTDPLFPPYRRAFVFKSGYPSCGTLSSNISSNIVTMFVFPQNAEPLDICEPKGGQFGTENGNPTIYWVENSDNSSSREYTIFFDIVPLRNGFNAGFALTLVQITLLAVSMLTIRKMTFSWRRRLSSRHPHEPIRSVPGSLVAIIGVMGALLIADLSVLNTYGLNLSQNGILTLFVVQLACFLTALLYNIYVWFVSER